MYWGNYGYSMKKRLYKSKYPCLPNSLDAALQYGFSWTMSCQYLVNCQNNMDYDYQNPNHLFVITKPVEVSVHYEVVFILQHLA